ncbi:ethanolamine utilization protein EutN [Vibrio tubiashii]|uniref:EutN/CcmL family microcompartment protein n=1 Tax=Vibrio tubiashii TaxID=29498 RepID=UPI001EFC3D25|nr:EutN/CcmL family microcompartment protein [Vibrio tubiashii]MCG9579531.1 ethanolamine utilization protein EutN [Vibrio tubiashii]
MITGKVTGKLWVSRKVNQLPAGALVIVSPNDEKQNQIVALDPLGCGEGEQVLIVTGSIAADYFSQPDVLVDAIVVASIDH